MPSPTEKRKIGLIAGNGSFPLLFAAEARRQGETVIAVALIEEADPKIEQAVDAVAWHSLGQLGKTIRYFKDQGVTRAVMAGQVKHTQLFRDIVPDLLVTKLLARVVNKKADTLLSAVTKEFEDQGIQFLPSTTYLDHLLCPKGAVTRRKPNSSEQADIEFGLPLARSIAGSDIGQTLIVKDKTVVAVEAMEGTDACIRRAGQIAGPGCIIVKVARPKQDLRFDVPVTGPRTIESMKEAGAAVLAVEAGQTLLLQKDEILSLANASELCITGV
jgi:DUF1009 family protein